ncbi:MAG TPA: hypothetical protein VFZ91_01750 [Allosphingosinicella sp.]
MNDPHTSETRERGRIFSAPIRRLSADEIDLVVGGDFSETNFGKTCGGVDNHSHEMGTQEV